MVRNNAPKGLKKLKKSRTPYRFVKISPSPQGEGDKELLE